MAKKVVLASLVLMAAFFVGGCKKQQGGAAQTVPARDLGGMQIIVHRWAGNYDTATYQPQSDADRRTLDYRIGIEKQYNFKIVEKHVGNNWEGLRDSVMTSIPAGTPDAQIYIIQPDWVMALFKQGLLAPLSDIPGVDFGPNNPAGFTQGIRDAYTYGGKTYAFGLLDQTLCNQGNVVYFNKRVFQEAGIDPNTPYDMQKAGTWTWDAFLDLAKRLTRDTNGDRITDIYGVGSLGAAIVDGYLMSNGPSSGFILKDANGLYVNAIGNPASIAALNAAKRLETEGVLFSNLQLEQWDGARDVFAKEGRIAMLFAPDDEFSFQALQEMKDDWGMVVPPKGPSAATYGVGVAGDVGIISKSFSAKEQEDIMFAFQLWMAAPGYADWKAPYRNLTRDARTIDETFSIIFNGENQVFEYRRFVDTDGHAEIWGAGINPQQYVESRSNEWNQKVAEFNASMPR